jgi:tRNA guanosine-2'-O-methyltransferase
MDLDSILDLLDEGSRRQAFESCLSKLDTAPQLDLEALRVCIRLRPTPRLSSEDAHPNDNVLPGSSLTAIQGGQDANETMLLDQLLHLLVSRIPLEQLDSDHFYRLASILCSDGPFACLLFQERIQSKLTALLPDLSERAHKDAEKSNEAEASLCQAIRTATAYLTLMKCSYWLPSIHNHVISPGSLSCLAQFLGLPVIDGIAHDAISAFLSLLKRREPITVATPQSVSQPWLKRDPISEQMVLAEPIIDGSLWDRLSILDVKSHTSGESRIP